MKKVFKKACDIKFKLLFRMLLCMPLEAFAGTSSVESILDKVVHYLQGPIAKSIGLIAVIGTGYLCIVKQRFPKEQFAMVLLGLGIVFGSTSLYQTLVS